MDVCLSSATNAMIYNRGTYGSQEVWVSQQGGSESRSLKGFISMATAVDNIICD
jgi:hypothetical protein